jgi:16S rRNA (cytosine967-C5)-methyltransferase
MGVLRWRSRLDGEIATHSSQPLAKLDLEILIAIRIALYQFRWLDRIPARAALHESVELVKRARKRSAASFVNAVLRQLSAVKAAHLPHAGNLNSSKSLASELAHPEWIVERWIDAYGLDDARQVCTHNQAVPNTNIRLRNPSAEEHLNEEGITLSPGKILKSARRVDAGDVTKTRAFRTNEIVIQDEASQLVAALVSATPQSGAARILDCCAAPGGKTLAIADRNPGAAITAVELHPHRARLLKKLVTTASGARIQVIAADATHLPISGSFENILADVPCSGTGTLARNPEIKWRLTPCDLAELQQRQIAILRAALERLIPGGKLIYSTCSLEKEENEEVVAQLLADSKFVHLLDCRIELERLRSANELAWPDTASLTCGPFLRTIPGVPPCDGFFAAIFQSD